MRRTPEEALFNSLMEQYHYLGYEQPVGEHLKYLVKARGQVIACLAWQSAPRHLKVRDRYIGMERRSARAQRALAGLQHALSDSAVGAGRALGLAHSGAHGQAGSARLATAVRTSDLLAGNVRRYLAFSRDVLSRGQLAGDRHDGGPRASRADVRTDAAGEADAGLATPSQVPGVAQRMKRPRMDVNLEELDRIIERGTHAPLSESESEKLKSALHALAGMLPQPRSTEKTKAVLGPPETPAPKNDAELGKSATGATALRPTRARKSSPSQHPTLHTGDACPGCGKGQSVSAERATELVRIVGQAPLAGNRV